MPNAREQWSEDRTKIPVFVEEFRNKLTKEIEEEVKDPAKGWSADDKSIAEAIRGGEKIPYHRWVYDKLCRLGQDLRLSWQEIDSLIDMIMEKRGGEK
jgi:hypothetical protein